MNLSQCGSGLVKVFTPTKSEEGYVCFDNSVIDEYTPALDREWQGIKGAINTRLEHLFGWANMKEEEAAEVEEATALAGDSGNRKRQGPTTRTQVRGEVFKRIKDEHPTWSQSRVAQEACKDLGEVVTDNTVRNTYRLLGWTWERGDRVR
jgi:hypothetical protein